eukprot:39895-Rhodomonas_salina.1
MEHWRTVRAAAHRHKHRLQLESLAARRPQHDPRVRAPSARPTTCPKETALKVPVPATARFLTETAI